MYDVIKYLTSWQKYLLCLISYKLNHHTTKIWILTTFIPRYQCIYNLNNLFGDNFLLRRDSLLANSRYSHVAMVQYGTLSMRYRPPSFPLYLSTHSTYSYNTHIQMTVSTAPCLFYQVRKILSLRLFLIFRMFLSLEKGCSVSFPFQSAGVRADNVISTQPIAHVKTCKLVCKFCHKLLTSICNVLTEEKILLT